MGQEPGQGLAVASAQVSQSCNPGMSWGCDSQGAGPLPAHSVCWHNAALCAPRLCLLVLSQRPSQPREAAPLKVAHSKGCLLSSSESSQRKSLLPKGSRIRPGPHKIISSISSKSALFGTLVIWAISLSPIHIQCSVATGVISHPIRWSHRLKEKG